MKRLGRGVIVLAVTGIAFVAGCSGPPEASSISFPGAAGSAQPRLTSGPDGTTVLSWLEPDGRDRVLKFARLDGDHFGSPQEIVRNDNMFVNWADFPSVTPITDAVWFAHWLQKRPNSGAYDVATAISTDGGSTWAGAEQMNEDEAIAEHGFSSVFSWGGDIAAFWLDGRDLANWSFDNPDALLGTSLRLARYDATGDVARREIVDELVCDCCAPDVAMTSSGPIVAYRDRTEDEIRDIVVSRFVGGAWSAPLDLGNEGWFIEGCPVNGPAIAARGEDVAAVWFTAFDGAGHVRLARSGDGGATFSDPISVDDDGPYGQTGIVLDRNGRAVVSWWRRSANGGIDLVVRGYARDGSIDAELTVAHEVVAQPIDVPQLIATGDGYLVAWTTFDGDGDVRLAALDL